MTIKEANDRLNNPITEKQLWGVNSLYLLLDLHKDDFCKIVNAVGIEPLLKKQDYYERLFLAEQEMIAKARYQKAKLRLEYLENEKADLQRIINNYENGA